MDASSQDGKKKEYVTVHRVQAWFLGRSRDNWKQKYKKVKAHAKRLQNRVNDVTRSRESWRRQVEELKAENAALREQAALKKTDHAIARTSMSPMQSLCDDRPISIHGYGAGIACLYLRLVLVANVSLRGASRVIKTVSDALGLELPVPHWTTGRQWLLRVGHSVLVAEKTVADDWAWIIDHSVQIGQDKCLVILGIRLCDLPERGQSLRHEDMELIALITARSWTRAQVDAALQATAEHVGHVPRAIITDQGPDLSGGIALFQRRHPNAVHIHDAKHKAACLLKARLEKNPRWLEFQTRVAQTRCSVQQTEMAFLTPSAPKPKARFMNLGQQLIWGKRVLAIVRKRPEIVRQSVTAKRLKEKLGWIEAFADDLTEWSQWQQVVDVSVTLVNCQGIYRGVSRLLTQQVSQLDAVDASGRQLAAELVKFVRGQERLARPKERFPGSTEVLESCFGKFKQLEKQQSRGGFTQLLLGFGSLLAKIVPETVREALQASGAADVRAWAAQHLGATVFAQRKMAYASATENG